MKGSSTVLGNDGSFKLSDAELLASKVALPCGRILPNRFVKVAMYEHLAKLFGGPPNELHVSLYSKWAQGGWGMIITGNFQVSPHHLSLGRDIVIPAAMSTSTLEPFRNVAAAIHALSGKPSQRPLGVVQLSHTGRQSPRFIGGRFGSFRQPVAPSARRLGEDTNDGYISKLCYAIGFQVPHALEEHEVQEVVGQFVHGAHFVHKAGFDGVELHAGHGYLLSQFLSPKLNNRTDRYGDRFLIIGEIINRIRAELPSDFVLGIKLNAGDYSSGGMTEDEALGHIRRVSTLRIDFIEISGGNYENPVFGRSSPREAFFASFSRRVLQEMPQTDKPSPLIILTGGLRTPSQLSQSIIKKHAQLLGIGRLAVLSPDLPRRLSPTALNNTKSYRQIEFPDSKLYIPSWTPKLAGAGIGTAWYTVAIRRIAENRRMDINSTGSLGALLGMWVWLTPQDRAEVYRAVVVLVIILVIVWIYGT